jgi:hypothetical protein
MFIPWPFFTERFNLTRKILRNFMQLDGVEKYGEALFLQGHKGAGEK